MRTRASPGRRACPRGRPTVAREAELLDAVPELAPHVGGRRRAAGATCLRLAKLRSRRLLATWSTPARSTCPQPGGSWRNETSNWPARRARNPRGRDVASSWRSVSKARRGVEKVRIPPGVRHDRNDPGRVQGVPAGYGGYGRLAFCPSSPSTVDDDRLAIFGVDPRGCDPGSLPNARRAREAPRTTSGRPTG